ncbi:MAG: proline dehydrogenase family protein [Bacteroidota bacterium]|nr:proline dehydrogenase family protein [Bacteroidota bacterium]
MGLARNTLLWASENPYLLQHVPKYKFVRRALTRFMPGENLEEAMSAARTFQSHEIPTVFTYLGESINDLNEAARVRDHYLMLLEKIAAEKLDIEISVKLTQLGLDLSPDHAYENMKALAEKARRLRNVVWIDMERSHYVDATLELYRKVKKEFSNTGICLQSYLRRTKQDVEKLLDVSPMVRLVKGAYNEPKETAFPEKATVDRNYEELSMLLLKGIKENGTRAAFGTHDTKLHRRIIEEADRIGLPKKKVEIQMLYGIKRNEQLRLAQEGHTVRVLISYGHAWYKWYVRRLAERPANAGFVLKNIFVR